MPKMKVYEIQYVYTVVGYATVPATTEDAAINKFNKDPSKYRGIDEGDTQEQIIGIKEVQSWGDVMNYSRRMEENRLMEKHT